MPRLFEVSLSPEEAYDDSVFRHALFRKLKISDDGAVRFRIVKRSLDARGPIKVLHKVEVYLPGEHPYQPGYSQAYPKNDPSRPVVIVGSGPAGLFAALRLLEAGIKPIILERGKDVKTRRRDLASINKHHIVNPESNYCFGEGGAGTYSDGKLYTRSGKRGNVQRVLEILVAHGAKEEVLYEAHPHVGTNRLPALVGKIRETITDAGGELRFNTRVDNLLIGEGEVKGVESADGDKIMGDAVILCAGHSARELFRVLAHKKIRIDAKPFAIGVRIEHPQSLIDQTQYHCGVSRGPWLPAASYSLVHQVVRNGGQRGVFSFCMCPGGFIVPSATAHGEVVVNGMSPSKRNSYFANSGIVVEVSERDFASFDEKGPLAGMEFQSSIEKEACRAAGGRQSAPAQRMIDFVNHKSSADLPSCSYQPGLVSTDLHAVLPAFISGAIRDGLNSFGRKMKGYLTNDAVLVGVESRTSSPVRIPRDREKLEHVEVARLFPCGEGAGYSGGIVSAALDGERCAESVARMYFGRNLPTWEE